MQRGVIIIVIAIAALRPQSPQRERSNAAGSLSIPKLRKVRFGIKEVLKRRTKF